MAKQKYTTAQICFGNAPMPWREHVRAAWLIIAVLALSVFGLLRITVLWSWPFGQCRERPK